jgi:hypothetical protein
VLRQHGASDNECRHRVSVFLAELSKMRNHPLSDKVKGRDIDLQDILAGATAYYTHTIIP